MSDQFKCSPHSFEPQQFDVILVGGGPVGLLAAYMLTQKQFTVALVDRLDYQEVLHANFDGRTFTYAYGSKTILEEVGLWEGLAPHATKIKDIYITADHKAFYLGDGLHYEAGRIKVEGYDASQSAMGFNIETRHFRKHVFTNLQRSELFYCFAPETITEIQFGEVSNHVSLASGTVLKAPLIIGCDGKQSMLRSRVGITTKMLDYKQKAIVGLLNHKQPHHNIAYEHFLKSGPLAILPMQDDAKGKHQSGFIWSLVSERADHYYNLDNTALSSELHTYFGNILGDISLFGNRWIFPLDATIVNRYVDHRFVLIGDAAHAIHPVAGQGFNLGIRDAYALTKHLVTMRSLGLDYGSLTGLKEYEASRRGDVLSMTSMCHGLVRLFSNESRSLDHLRKFGLRFTNAMPSVKDKLTKHAMGL